MKQPNPDALRCQFLNELGMTAEEYHAKLHAPAIERNTWFSSLPYPQKELAYRLMDKFYWPNREQL